jgi:hypothetical protein
LLSAVHHDVNVLVYKAGCKALGLIEILVTGPLWRTLIKKKDILNMNKKFQDMLDCFIRWGDDASLFLSCDEALFHDLVCKDKIYYSLKTHVADIDEMCKQCLELIFKGLVEVTKRMLKDHLKDGCLDNPDATLIDEAKAVQTTNAESERDFGMLDRIMRLKPKALDIVYEGLIMFSRNKTSKWRDSLDKDTRAAVLEKARMSVSTQKLLFQKRKQIIWKLKAERFMTSIAHKVQ